MSDAGAPADEKISPAATAVSGTAAGAANVRASVGADDPLLRCLRIVAKHFERPASDTALLAGLPLGDEGMTPELFGRAAERVGIWSKVARMGLKQLIPLHLPVVLVTRDGNAVVLLSVTDAGNLRLHDPRVSRIVEIPYDQFQAHYDGTCILVRPDPTGRAEQAGSPGRRDHWLWGVARRYWRNYLKVVVASVLINVLALASSLFILNVYDRVLPNQAIATLWVLAIGVMLAFVFDLILRFARSIIVDHVGRRVDLKVSSAIFERILNTGLEHRPETTGAFVNRASEYEFVRDFFTSSTITLAIDMLFTVVFLLVIYALAGWIVIVPMIGIGAVVIIGLIVQSLIGREMAAVQEQSALRHSLMVEAVSSMETVKSLRGESYLLRKWDQLVRSGSDLQERIRKLSSLSTSTSFFVQQMITVWIVIGGVYRFAEGDMSMGAIIATVILANRATAPLGQLAAMLTRARHAIHALKVLDGIMALPDERDGVSHRVERTIERGAIEFRDVEFSYPGSPRKTLTGASFRIAPGERVGVIGRIGSGKTTIGRLMAGLYFPSSGEVLIDGIDVRQYHPHEVRSAVSLVVQDADLFHGSVKANLLMADPTADDADLVRAAKLSGLDQIITAHPQGFEMSVGEKGSSLSGGQRQIVALARTLVAPFKVLFLDEPTSAMDTMTERQLIARLKDAVPEHATLVLCTHRHSALALVDRLLVVDGGRIIADGPKDAVLEALMQQARPAKGPVTSTGKIEVTAVSTSRPAVSG
jgi:ATP-binding cassette, subfamily C, bacterial LapB